MKRLSALAQVCVTLIESERMTIEEAPPVIKEEVITYYENKKEKEND